MLFPIWFMVRAGAKAKASVNVKLGLGLELGLGLGLGLMGPAKGPNFQSLEDKG